MSTATSTDIAVDIAVDSTYSKHDPKTLGVANGPSKTLGPAKYCRISRVSQSRFLNGYVRLAGSFLIPRCLGVSIFCKAKGLEVPIRLFVF